VNTKKTVGKKEEEKNVKIFGYNCKSCKKYNPRYIISTHPPAHTFALNKILLFDAFPFPSLTAPSP
jgi:hypothetical protein